MKLAEHSWAAKQVGINVLSPVDVENAKSLTVYLSNDGILSSSIKLWVHYERQLWIKNIIDSLSFKVIAQPENSGFITVYQHLRAYRYYQIDDPIDSLNKTEIYFLI